jgi:hypothetical protein
MMYSKCLKSVERFDFYLNKWEEVAELNVPRRALTAVTLPNGIYAIGFLNLTIIIKYYINCYIK